MDKNIPLEVETKSDPMQRLKAYGDAYAKLQEESKNTPAKEEKNHD